MLEILSLYFSTQDKNWNCNLYVVSRLYHSKKNKISYSFSNLHKAGLAD